MDERSASKLIVVARWSLVALGLAALVAAFVLTRAADEAGAAGVTYVCPMHPDVTSSVPGDCSICKMELEPKRGPAASGEPQRIETVVSTGEAAVTGYVCPMHPDVTSAAPAKCRVCKMPLRRKEAAAPSDVKRATASASSSVGAAVFSFHDISRARPRTSSRDMRGLAWLESSERGAALLFLDEIELLKAEEEGLFFPSNRANDGTRAGIEVRLTAEAPTPWDASTSLVRFEVRGGKKLEAGRTGSIKLATRTRNGLSIPYTAVIQSPAGPYVLVLSEDLQTLAKRTVKLGSVLFGYAAIVSGLEDGERVAAMRTYSLDALRKENER